MSIPVKIGDPVPLELNLEKVPSGTKFVRALITDSAGSALAGSPVAMGSVTSKKYVPSSPFVMPNEQFITAVYEISDDAGFTSFTEFFDSEDRFISDVATQSGFTSGQADLELEVVGEDLGLETASVPDLDLEAGSEELTLETEQEQTTIIEVDSVDVLDTEGG